MREGDHSFRLRDGRSYRYDPAEAALEMFIFACNPDPDAEEPEFVRKVKQARDPEAVLARFRDGDMDKAPFDPLDILHS